MGRNEAPSMLVGWVREISSSGCEGNTIVRNSVQLKSKSIDSSATLTATKLNKKGRFEDHFANRAFKSKIRLTK